MVADLADALRDDARSNPSVFPPGSKAKFQKLPDEELANWFLENLDNIERTGYEGTVYSRDGVNNEWIARRYIAGSHNWEDLTGVMNMNLRDWYLLKNRNMLDPAHQDLFKFNGVRDVGRYLSTHYHDKLKDVRDAAAAAAVKKMSKTAKIVDNEDYAIYTVFNWAAARTVGLGTQWCTANSEFDGNYRNYSKRAMLFQLFPKEPEEINKQKYGKIIQGPEKYQFDAGSLSFMDIADERAPSASIKEKFPYLYTDLVGGLTANKEKLQTVIDAMADDPVLSSSPATKVTKYNIDDEIAKLSAFVNNGYFTTKRRPAVADDTAPPALTESRKKVRITLKDYSMDKDVKAMLESLNKYDRLLKESTDVGIKKTTVNEDDIEDEENEIEAEEQVVEGADPEVIEWMRRFSKLGKMG